MRTKNLADVKSQMARIERMMMADRFFPKDVKRYKRWCKITSTIDRQILAYFGFERLWDAYGRHLEPLPYDVRITH